MELANTDKNPAVALPQNLSQNPVVKQLGVMIGIAASVALGVAVVLWSQTPSYSLLFGNLAQKDATEVVTALEQAGVEFKIDEASGALMVASDKLQEVRMKLAGMGLPRSDSLGFELLQQETGFGTSRAMEAARFHRALEGELARTIGALANIESSRVHLATPKQSVFLRNREKPSASVVVKLYPGRTLEKPQVDAIVHLVASSVPELETGRVTVVDHKGNMLSSTIENREMMLSASQFEYTKKQEEHYRQRVESILAPIIGLDKVRAQVTAELDFTVSEQTAERFNPDFPSLRSEQIDEQASSQSPVQGVPGALSNQPPASGSAPEVAAGGEDGGASEDVPRNTSKRATRNFELDRTVSHTRLSTGNLRRLSVAVVVDDLVTLGENGSRVRRERTPEEINRITQLVKEAIGFNGTRGDSVKVINASFMEPVEMEPLPEPPIWEQPWVWNLLKQVGGIVLVIMLIFFVLKPTLHRLTAPPVPARNPEGGSDQGGSERDGDGNPKLHSAEGGYRLPGPEAYEDTLEAARKLVSDDPKRVAQVIKSWVAEDAG
ncbi:MAG: flagellar M-ring protein FliF [Gammaproteobacteria bacterium]|nr:flagellar M-ring protein FliF [Gammaproteobacteria bacterium]